MSENDWSSLGVSGLLPTGTVTLLLADVEGSIGLWQADPETMATAIARLDVMVSEQMSAHRGVRPVEQGEGDSFVAAFARASDAVACALALQRAPLAPIRLRIGIHTGEVMLRDEGNYAGPAINRTARLRDLAHGGQTVVSAVVRDLIEDSLPANAWLVDLGTHHLRDLPRPDHVAQLCHPDLKNDFPPLRSSKMVGVHGLPTHLTSFVGRSGALAELGDLLAVNRLVTATGAGGAGKTRLAVRVAAEVASGFPDGVWYVDLAPITDADLVPATAAAALRVIEHPSHSTTECVARFIAGRRMLIVLDNCEHLLEASATIASGLLAACPAMAILATSREPLGVEGETTWRVPSLSLTDEARDLFVDRARLVQPDFVLGPETTATIAEICRRLDGMPLAIELAAARTRALSPRELLDSLHDRFRLLTGGARTATQRQQTLRASVDWSHALLTEPERVLFRRLAAFCGGFDIVAAEVVAGDGQLERFQVRDQLTLLIDKSLLGTENRCGVTRYMLLETVRQYALEKLGVSGEADAVRSRHRDHYTELAAAVGGDRPTDEGNLGRLECEIDNFRAAFAWSREQGITERALVLASALQPLWRGRRLREGLAWFSAALGDDGDRTRLDSAILARALADEATLDGSTGNSGDFGRAEQALAMAREVGDPVLLSRVLAACLYTAGRDATMTQRYLPEALAVAREVGDPHRLADVLARQAYAAFMVDGDPERTRLAAAEGLAVADAIDDGGTSRICRWSLAAADWMEGNLEAAVQRLDAVVPDAAADGDFVVERLSVCTRSNVLSYLGHPDAARAASEEALRTAGELGEIFEGLAQNGLTYAALAEGDAAAAHAAGQASWFAGFRRESVASYAVAEAALAVGDLETARGLVDEALSFMGGFHRKMVLTVAARLAMVEGRFDAAEQHAHEAIAIGSQAQSLQGLGELFECLAQVAIAADSWAEAARLLGAAAGVRQRTGEVRFRVHDEAFDAVTEGARYALAEHFDDLHAEGFALTPGESVAYARRGRGERKRPASGWAALTPSERDVVRLLSEGLPNKMIATRLFISPRTVQSHLTHVYAKLGLTSRVRLAQEAGRHDVG